MAEKAIPSREFMIQQAVLNAVALEWPYTVKAEGGVPGCLRRMIDVCGGRDDSLANNLRWRIVSEFRAISESYGVMVV